MIFVSAQDGENMDDVILQIELLLVQRHVVTLDTEDFVIQTQADIIQTQESTTASFRSLLAWVAGGIPDRGWDRHHEYYAGQRH